MFAYYSKLQKMNMYAPIVLVVENLTNDLGNVQLQKMIW